MNKQTQRNCYSIPSFVYTGQTASEWKQTLDLFRLGKIKLLVSTTVVEEGLDIPDCSLLVKYELTQTEIGQVQAEGIPMFSINITRNMLSNQNYFILVLTSNYTIM